MTASSDRGLESCYTCRFLKGAREQADILRYAVVASAAEAMAVHWVQRLKGAKTLIGFLSGVDKQAPGSF